jgi:hypothetical protein
MLDKLFEHAPSIIREARQNILGVVSLIVLVLAGIATLLFKDEAMEYYKAGAGLYPFTPKMSCQGIRYTCIFPKSVF